ncbi:protein kinase [Lujinxingia vulgaris]|uniref:Protein kinase n=1 Tax=Lujinxingia vulgaris TaxID=2600176 RepID=A0A5C6X8U3_9DELT|nr:protein kinase [Lujinxingia vulgaris]TXD36111.1 protein kinase [Lujinxingia vulgaris]
MSRLESIGLGGRDTTLRHQLVRNLVLLTLLTAGAVALVFLIGSYRAVEELSEQAIDQAVERADAELDRFFVPVSTQLEVLADWGTGGELSLAEDDVEAMNARLMPVLRRLNQVTSVLYADAEGREYLLLEQGGGWVNRLVDRKARGEVVRWVRRDADGKVVERWEEKSDYETRKRPWYIGAMSAGKRQVHWTEPYTFFTTKDPGITASTRFEAPDGGAQVVALDVMLSDVSAFSTGIRPTERGYVAVLAGDETVMGLPARGRYEAEEAIRADVLKSTSELGLWELQEALKTWREDGSGQGLVEVRAAGERYWAGFRSVALGQRELTIATMVPRSDFTGVIERQRNVTLGLTLLALGLAVLVGVRTSRSYRRRFEQVIDAAQRLGQYTLETKIGEGGMGTVYRARHAMLQRPTAVKLLKGELYDRESVRRFEREVQLTCKLTHPNTITIFDYGRTTEGVFYYAMELLDGVTLLELINYCGPFDEGRTIFLLRQVCGALAEAHEAGLIHRDIKPGNIVVGDRGGLGDFVKVLDFGLVKDIHAPREVQLTGQDILQGSPGFMAPEVILGQGADDVRVDIFAMGAVAYVLLTGQNPYEDSSAVKVMLKQINEDPPRPSEVLGRVIDADLEDLVMQCLSRKAAERPATMRELAEALEACGASARWDAAQAKAWWERHGAKLVPAAKAVASESDDESGELAMQVTLEVEAPRESQKMARRSGADAPAEHV